MPADQSAPSDWIERTPRKNLLLAATIESGVLQAPVRIRNLSESGALLEGAALPLVGEKLVLRRMEIEIGATVVWRTTARCGVKFDGWMSVADWVSGKRLEATPSQARVDQIQAAVRSGQSLPTEKPAAPGSTDMLLRDLDARIAEELAFTRRLLEAIGDELVDDPLIVQRHARVIQNFDLAGQILGHLATVLMAQDRGAAVRAIGMDDLRARLLRRTLFGD